MSKQSKVQIEIDRHPADDLKTLLIDALQGHKFTLEESKKLNALLNALLAGIRDAETMDRLVKVYEALDRTEGRIL